MLSNLRSKSLKLFGRHVGQASRGPTSEHQRTFCSISKTPSDSELLSLRPSLKAIDKRHIRKEEILPFEEYARARRSVYYPLRRLLKKHRLLMVGPFATITFESYDLMWLQVQEMAFVEKGSVDEELEAYNPLVPNGNNLIVTLMFEIENPVRRDALLHGLGHVEDSLSLKLRGQFSVTATSVDGHEMERTSPEGKTSAVHFLKFDLTPTQKQTIQRLAQQNANPQDDALELSFGHENYQHGTKIPHATLKEIATDLL